jgi:hypothetical protein
LLEGVRRLLAERLRIEGAELDSIIGIVQSQVDLSLGGQPFQGYRTRSVEHLPNAF